MENNYLVITLITANILGEGFGQSNMLNNLNCGVS